MLVINSKLSLDDSKVIDNCGLIVQNHNRRLPVPCVHAQIFVLFEKFKVDAN